ncbi:MAG TPA: cobalamin biosynthesis protein, partial [Rhodocyclaceae bacterium]
MLSMTIASSALGGALLDRLLGEPRRFHPLVGFGRLADEAEKALRRGAPGDAVGNRLRGLAAWSLIVVPPVLAASLLCDAMPLAGIADALLLWFAL